MLDNIINNQVKILTIVAKDITLTQKKKINFKSKLHSNNKDKDYLIIGEEKTLESFNDIENEMSEKVSSINRDSIIYFYAHGNVTERGHYHMLNINDSKGSSFTGYIFEELGGSQVSIDKKIKKVYLFSCQSGAATQDISYLVQAE